MNQWIEQLSEVRRRIQEREQQRKVSDDPGIRRPRPKEQVVGSQDVKWKPVDRVAALVVAPANWIHKPDAFSRSPQNETTKPQPRKNMNKFNYETSDGSGVIEQPTRAVQRGMQGVPMDANPEDYVNFNEIAAKVIDHINKQPHQLTDLARAAVDAKAVLDKNMDGLGGGMEDFNAKVKVMLNDLRQTRMAFVTEAAQMLNPLKEIRQFFIGKDYETEIERLKEFVALCERLEGLKARGTLDAISDTIIKLSV